MESEIDQTINMDYINDIIEYTSCKGTREREILTCSIFEIEQLGKTKLKISGIALAEGVWKNVIYSGKEILKAAKDMIGKPLMVEHGQTKEFGKTIVGKVVNAYYDKILHSLVFVAEVFHPKAVELVNERTLGAVSSSTWMDKKSLIGETKVGFNYEFAELSLVRQPACDRCFIYAVEKLSKGKDLKVTSSNINIDKKVKETMSSEVDETLETEEEMPEMLYAILELPEELSLEELRRARRVVSYYYGQYGYPYQGYPYRYPYGYGYGSPYKYPHKKSDVLYAVIELDSEEELDELRKIYKVKKYYKGKYGYPTPGYPAPYKKKIEKKAEDLANSPKEALEAWKNKTPAPGTPSPNPEQNQDKVICPVDDKEFKSFDEFQKHWDEEHAEKYGSYRKVMRKAALAQEPKIKIVKMKNGRFIVFTSTKKKGFGAWKILGNFATRKEAQDAVDKLIEEDLAEKLIKCPVDGEEFQTHDEFLKHWADKHQEKYGEYGRYVEKKVAKKYYPYYKYYKKYKKGKVSKEEESAYTEFIGKCMKTKEKDIPEIKDRMKACAAEWTKQKGEPEKKSMMEVEELSEKKEETPTPAPIPEPTPAPTPAPVPEVKAESVPEPKVEEPKKEEPKAEEKPVETLKETPKETPKELPTLVIRVETVPAPAPVAVPAVVPTPEPIKTEEKEMTVEEIMKALKGKSAELIMRVYARKE